MAQFRPEPGPALAAADHAHRLGYAGAFLFDHLWPLSGRDRPLLECWTLLAALAARIGRQAGPPTQTGRQAGPPIGFALGTLVTRAGLRAPALLARMADTVGQALGRPLIVGVGTGDAASRAEHAAFGIPFPDPAVRPALLTATVAALRGPQAGSPPPAVWLGGRSARVRELAGRTADGWNAWAATPEELAAGGAHARRAAAAAGRDPAAVAVTWGGQVLVGEDPGQARTLLGRWSERRPPAEVARTLAGDPDAVCTALRALGEAGAAWCVLSFVGGPADRMRALLAERAGLLPRPWQSCGAS